MQSSCELHDLACGEQTCHIVEAARCVLPGAGVREGESADECTCMGKREWGNQNSAGAWLEWAMRRRKERIWGSR